MPDTVTGLESLDFASIFRGSSRLAGAPIEIVMFIIFWIPAFYTMATRKLCLTYVVAVWELSIMVQKESM